MGPSADKGRPPQDDSRLVAASKFSGTAEHKKTPRHSRGPLTVGVLFTLVRKEMQSTFVVARWHGVRMGVLGCGRDSRFLLSSLRSGVGMTKSWLGLGHASNFIRSFAQDGCDA